MRKFIRIAALALPILISQSAAAQIDPTAPKDKDWVKCTQPFGGGLPGPALVQLCTGVLNKGGFGLKYMATAYYYRAFGYLSQGNFATALPDLNQAILLNPQYAQAYNNRGFAYAKMGQDARAAQDFTQAIALDPRYKQAYNNRADAYFRLQNYPGAIADYTQAIAFDPGDTTLYYNRGLSYYRLAQLPSAIADFDQVLRINPNDRDAANNKAAAQNSLQRAKDVYAEQQRRKEEAEAKTLVDAFSNVATQIIAQQNNSGGGSGRATTGGNHSAKGCVKPLEENYRTQNHIAFRNFCAFHVQTLIMSDGKVGVPEGLSPGHSTHQLYMKRTNPQEYMSCRVSFTDVPHQPPTSPSRYRCE